MTTLRKPDHLPANLVQGNQPCLPCSSRINQNVHIPQSNTLSLTPIDRPTAGSGNSQSQPGPYLGILRPWAPRKFCVPPPLFLRIQLCVSKNNTKKTDKRQNIIVFSV
jgi:hypothetical protein